MAVPSHLAGAVSNPAIVSLSVSFTAPDYAYSIVGHPGTTEDEGHLWLREFWVFRQQAAPRRSPEARPARKARHSQNYVRFRKSDGRSAVRKWGGRAHGPARSLGEPALEARAKDMLSGPSGVPRHAAGRPLILLTPDRVEARPRCAGGLPAGDAVRRCGGPEPAASTVAIRVFSPSATESPPSGRVPRPTAVKAMPEPLQVTVFRISTRQSLLWVERSAAGPKCPGDVIALLAERSRRAAAPRPALPGFLASALTEAGTGAYLIFR